MNYIDEIAALELQKRTIAHKFDNIIDPDDPGRFDLSLLLHNNCNQSYPPLFLQNFTKIISRIWESILVRKIASVQPLFQAAGSYYYLSHLPEVDMQRNNVAMQVQPTTCTWQNVSGMPPTFNLDPQEELNFIIAQELTLIIDRMCIKQMMKEATLKTKCERANFDDCLRQTSEAIHEVTTCKPNWIVTSPEITYWLKFNEEAIPSLGYAYVGECNGCKVYKDPLLTSNKVLIGYKGNHPYDAGFVFCIYRLLDLFLDRINIISKPVVVNPNLYSVIAISD